ncbi:hypothetical protein GCM10028808_56260 [Spirosoma migulaei]
MKTLWAGLGLSIGLTLHLACAQTPLATLTGQVLDAKTGEPLPFATVYLNNSSLGTNADQNGSYRLTAVPLGNQEVVGSFLGYQTTRLPLRLTDARPRTLDLKLEPADQSLADVTVRARHDKTWARHLTTFTRELLGNRPQARQCRIINPNVLSFLDEKGHLRVQAAQPLLIENQALGYRLYYNLLYFDLFQGKMQFAGTSRFEELLPTDARQKIRWQTNRVAVYQGSIQHLLASLLAGTHEQAGYRVYRTPLTDEGNDRALPFVRTQERQYIDAKKAADLIKPGSLSFERQFSSDQPLEIYYDRVYAANSPYHDSPYAYSMLLLPNHSLEVNTNGWITQSNGLDVRGYMGNDRLATLLPTDWSPPTSHLLLTNSITAGRVAQADAGLDSLTRLHKRQYEQTAPIVYLHTDKSFYLTGDQLWLSAYVLDASRQLPVIGPLGSVLEIELISPSGQRVQHQWVSLTEGRGGGCFPLADSLLAGTYRLRAMTSLDASADTPAFECTFPLFRAQSDGATPLPTSPSIITSRPIHLLDSLDVQFLPEGGRWLAGVSSRLGIKVVAPDGHGRALVGRILDRTNQEVARFQTNPLGMGQLRLTPQSGQQYRALIQTTTGQKVIALPAFEAEGWSLSVDATSDSSRLRVQIRATGRYSQQPVYVTLQSRQQVVYQQKWLLQKGEVQFSLTTASLPPGVSRLTLWDTTRQARAERLVFVPDRSGGVLMQVSLGKPHYEARQGVSIGFQLRDAEGAPVEATWSAAVTDADQVSLDTSRADLRTYLLLTGGLRGWIDSPTYYLEPEHAVDLDNLLLTQGWRRLPAIQPADSAGGWLLRGQVKDRLGQPLKGQSVVVLFDQGDQPVLRSTVTDQQGVFGVAGLLFRDTVRVRARVLGTNRNGVRFSFDPSGSRDYSTAVREASWHPQANQLADARMRQLAWPTFYRDSTARQLAEVVVRAFKPGSERPKEVTKASLHSEADNVLVVEPGIGVAEMKDLLARVPGINLLYQRNKSSFGDTSPLYLIDGVYADKETVFNGLTPSEVSRIEVLRNPTTVGIYGARGANGVIAIYTRTDLGLAQTLATSSSALVTGFSTAREFYVPRYAPTSAIPAGSPVDRRDVLFWQAVGRSDTNGLGRLVFPLSDIAKRVRITLQGLTNEGIPMAFTWELPVR